MQGNCSRVSNATESINFKPVYPFLTSVFQSYPSEINLKTLKLIKDSEKHKRLENRL